MGVHSEDTPTVRGGVGKGPAGKKRSAGWEEAAWDVAVSLGAERTPRKGAGWRSAPCRGSQCFFWTIPNVSTGISSLLPPQRRAQRPIWALKANALQTPKSRIFHSQPMLAVPSGFFSPSLCERDLLSGEVSFKHPAKTGGNFLHEWLFMARSTAEQNLY